MQLVENVLVGADPEIFVMNTEGALVSASGMNEGTKADPLVVPFGALQVDGMALEYNIEAAHSEMYFVNYNKVVLDALEDTLPEGHSLAYGVSTANFGKEYIDAQDEEAKKLGCEPDYNAWTGLVNEKPDEDTPFRTAAGHVHVGFCENAITGDPDYQEMCNQLVKEMDLYLGVVSVLLDPDTQRRSLYGAAGACRYKTYGVEYRTLSNFWVGNDEYTAWVYRATQKAVEAIMDGGTEGFDSVVGTRVTYAINNSCELTAEKLVSDFNLEVPSAM